MTLGANPSALAQVPIVSTPNQVPRTSDIAPPASPLPSWTSLPDRPDSSAPLRELGKPEDDLRVDVTSYYVDADAPPQLIQALPGLTRAYVGPGRGFEDLVNATTEVTRFLQRELGDYLGYAYLPEQDPAGGRIRIAVLEGRLDRVVLNWVEGLPVRREVVEAHLTRLRPGSVLKVREVERIVFLINDLRGISATFEVRPGRRRGTAQLVVDVKADKSVTGRVDADVNGNKAIGQVRLAALMQLHNLLGAGDGLTASALASHTGGLAFGLLGYVLPVGSDGLKVGGAVSAVRYQLDRKLFPIDLQGSAETINAYGLYPVVRSRNLNVFSLLSLDNKRYTDRQRSANTATRKTVNGITLGTNGDFRDSLAGGGVSTYELNLANGRIAYPEGRPGGLNDAPSFLKLGYGYTRLQDLLTGRLLGYVALRGQLSRRNLDSTEQFRLGGSDGLRGFSSGEGAGDVGTLLTTELRLLPPEAWFGSDARDMVLSLFHDYGRVRYRVTPSAVNLSSTPNSDTYTDVGVGLAWVRPGQFSLRASLARPLSGTPRNTLEAQSVRLYLSGSYPFN